MRYLIVNGPNINMLGVRDNKIYGNTNYKELCKELKRYAKEKKIKLDIFQSNSEYKLLTLFQRKYNKYDGFIINLGGYTHTSIVLRDAVELIKKKIIEVHISDIENREDFRKFSYIAPLASERIIGKGVKGYFIAIDKLMED